MNITVRVGGVINNSQTKERFLSIVEELFGEGYTLDEYIDMFNESPRAQHHMIVVHREVPDDAAAIKAKEEADRLAEEEAGYEEAAGDYFDAAEATLTEIAGEDVTIEFADDDA